MARRVKLGDPWVDHFPVWATDGINKVTGYSGFVSTVRLDGAVYAISPTIIEIGTSGEYRIEFTPPSSGFWTIEITIPINGEVWTGEAEIVQAETAISMTASDNDTDTIFGVWMSLDGQRLTDLTQISATINDSDGNIIIDLGTQLADSADGVFKFSTPSSGLSPYIPYVLVVSATRNGLTWTELIGFAGT